MTKSKPKNISGKRGRPAGSRIYNEKQVLDALQLAGGVLSEAVGILKKKYGRSVSRRSLCRWINATPSLQEALMEIDEVRLDFVESIFWKKIESGDSTSLNFYLSTKGRARGYVRKTELATPEPLKVADEPSQVMPWREIFDELQLEPDGFEIVRKLVAAMKAVQKSQKQLTLTAVLGAQPVQP